MPGKRIQIRPIAEFGLLTHDASWTLSLARHATRRSSAVCCLAVTLRTEGTSHLPRQAARTGGFIRGIERERPS